MQLQGHLFLRGSMSVIIGIWAEGREGVFKNSPLFFGTSQCEHERRIVANL